MDCALRFIYHNLLVILIVSCWTNYIIFIILEADVIAVRAHALFYCTIAYKSYVKCQSLDINLLQPCQCTLLSTSHDMCAVSEIFHLN